MTAILPIRPAASRRREAIGLAVIAAAIIAGYGYLSTSKVGELFIFGKSNSQEYYALQVEGFIHGQLAMRVDPPAALATLANPYDPTERDRIGQPGLHDVSYYKGRYYLYWGVAPALVLFLPFRLLTGMHFPQALATVLFCSGGFLASLAVFLGLRRRYFAACGPGVAWMVAVFLGLGNFCLLLVMRNGIWELPISAAYFFSCLGYWLVVKAEARPARRVGWLVAAGTAFGLAVGSRPHFVFCAGIVGAWLWWSGAAADSRPGVRRWRDAAAFLAPLGLAVVALLFYNYLRFDNPLEFGQKYQLAGLDQSHAKMLSVRFLPVNFYYNFLAPAEFQRYFPFVEVIRGYPVPPPAGYAGAEDPYGVLPNMPFFWLALAAPAVWARGFRSERSLGSWLALFSISFLVLAGIVLCFFSAANRYMVDFIPSLQLAAAVGFLMLVSLPGLKAAARPWVRAGLIAVVAYTAWFNLFAAFRHNGMFAAHRPAVYQTLARWFDRPVMRWEQWRGQPYGPVEMTVLFPRDRPAKAEPLLVTGASFLADYLFVYYDPDGRSVRLGYTRTIHGSMLSQPIYVDSGVPHRLRIESGALYPPADHPFFSHWDPERIATAKHTLRVAVDGVPYLQETQVIFETTPGFIRFGRNDVSYYIEPNFSGKILGLRRAPSGPAITPFAGGGFVRLAFVLPPGAAGRREPLIASGGGGSGELLFAVFDDASHVRLGLAREGASPTMSDSLSVVPGQIQLLEASLGSFYPHPRDEAQRQLAQALIVRFNGRLIWAEPSPPRPAGLSGVVIGADAWHSGVCEPAFSGRIVAVQPMDPLAPPSSGPWVFKPYWLPAGSEPAYGPWRVRASLPMRRRVQFEPLLVTGPSATQADYLWIHYRPDQASVILGYEHTGGGGPNSGVIPLDLGRPHRIEIALPSLYPPPWDDFFAGIPLLDMLADKTRALVKIDGVVRIDAPVKSYESMPAQATLGENRVSATFGRKFTGSLSGIERAVHGLPPGFADQAGPLEIAVRWPSAPPSDRREVVLASGTAESQDTLLLEYLDPDRARFVFRDHQGHVAAGAPFPVPEDGRSDLKVAWGGFFTEAARGRSPVDEWRRLQRSYGVWKDGVSVLMGAGDFAFSRPQTISLGVSSPVGAEFSGAIESVRRLPAGSP